MCVVHHKLTLVFRSMTGFERVLLDRLNRYDFHKDGFYRGARLR